MHIHRAVHTVHAEAKSISVLRCSSYVRALVLLCLLTLLQSDVAVSTIYIYVCVIGTLLYWATSERMYTM